MESARKKLWVAVLLSFAICFSTIAEDKPVCPMVVTEIEHYLKDEKNKTQRGTDAYYARVALEEALQAFKERNYGIGSIVVLKWKGTIYEFRDRNAMVSGYGLRDHAEARGLERAVAFLAGLKGKKVIPPNGTATPWTGHADQSYPVDTDFLMQLPDGMHVYGSLEPCPMCMVMMLNVGVKSSKSLAKDGELKQVDGLAVSDGAALATEEKFKGAPLVWQMIRKGQGLQFCIYNGDQQLSDLSLRIFLETRKQIDEYLSNQQ